MASPITESDVVESIWGTLDELHVSNVAVGLLIAGPHVTRLVELDRLLPRDGSAKSVYGWMKATLTCDIPISNDSPFPRRVTQSAPNSTRPLGTDARRSGYDVRISTSDALTLSPGASALWSATVVVEVRVSETSEASHQSITSLRNYLNDCRLACALAGRLQEPFEAALYLDCGDGAIRTFLLKLTATGGLDLLAPSRWARPSATDKLDDLERLANTAYNFHHEFRSAIRDHLTWAGACAIDGRPWGPAEVKVTVLRPDCPWDGASIEEYLDNLFDRLVQRTTAIKFTYALSESSPTDQGWVACVTCTGDPRPLSDVIRAIQTAAALNQLPRTPASIQTVCWCLSGTEEQVIHVA